MNPAYKHLEEPLKIGDFTLTQIAAFLIAAMVAMLWGFVISPLPPMLSLFTAIYIGGLPAMAVLMASTTDFDAIRMVRSFYRFQRRPGRFLAGAGKVKAGYVVIAPSKETKATRKPADEAALIVEALWQE